MHRFFALSVLLVGASCGSDPHAPATYVGDVDGTDMKIGIVTEGGKVAMFACGGPTSYAQATKWFRGASEPMTISFSSDGWVAKASASGDMATGTIDRGTGIAFRFTAKKVPEDGVAGLYELKDQNGTAGVVVIDSQHAQGALVPVNPAIAIEQIEAILPVSRVSDGIQVNVVEAMPRAITVTRVHAQ
jgi:hypothetical protein